MDELASPLWPIHLKPRPNELLSSWMIRLAHAHGYKCERLCRMLFGRNHALWARDVDRLSPPSVLGKLSEITGTNLQRTCQTTLQAYSGYLSEHVSAGGHSPWIVPVHVYHRHRTAPGLMFCPYCLQNDEIAFYRRTWRLAFVAVCTVHGTVLMDSCPNCISAVIPHRVDIGRNGATPQDRSFIRCWKCGFKLSTPAANKCSDELLAFTRRLESVVENGFLDWAGNPNLHSIPYFCGLRVLARFAAKEHPMGKKALETATLAERLAVLQRLAELQTAWPENFLKAVRDGKSTYCDIVGANRWLPMWLAQITLPLKRHQHPYRSDAEVVDIAQAVLHRAGCITVDAARQLFGANIPRHRFPVDCCTTVSHDNHETLLAFLDQSVASSFNQKFRFARLQDSVMFTLYRFTDMSAAQVCALKMIDMPPISNEPAPDEVWWDAPQSRVEAIRLLHRHVIATRRMFVEAEKNHHVFLSPHTGKPLKASGLQARFRQAIVAAALTAPVPNMASYKVR